MGSMDLAVKDQDLIRMYEKIDLMLTGKVRLAPTLTKVF